MANNDAGKLPWYCTKCSENFLNKDDLDEHDCPEKEALNFAMPGDKRFVTQAV